MSKSESDRMIEEYLKNVRSQLPDTFETEDLIEDLRAHIYESLNDKSSRHPAESRMHLTHEVLEDLGEPQVIADEFERTHKIEEREPEKSEIIKTVLRYLISVIVIIIAAWFVSSIPGTSIGFWPALIILFVFVLAESLIRRWQKEDS
ncbi:hypothetical protein EU537_03170 [Candidatus Thorarchaeota archaeon]|nr:MAG: hypothetical protein EU537_03170 [Candidatus Thorarchaeota archaeon]